MDNEPNNEITPFMFKDEPSDSELDVWKEPPTPAHHLYLDELNEDGWEGECFRTTSMEEPKPEPPAQTPKPKDMKEFDKIFSSLGPMMDVLMKEIGTVMEETKGKEEKEIEEEKESPELGETGTLAKYLCTILVGSCLWLIHTVLPKGKLRFMNPIIGILKMFDEELKCGEWDREFHGLDEMVDDLTVFNINVIIVWTVRIINLFIRYNRISIPTLTFVLGGLIL